jgi:hypothetical protein
MRIGPVALFVVALTLACGKPPARPAPPAPVPGPPAPVAITGAVFDPVDRTAGAIQHEATPGVTRARFGTLLDAFGAAVAAADAQPLDEAGRTLLGAYRQALDAYIFSDEVWQARIQRQTSEYGGDRPVAQIGTMKLDLMIAGANRYGIPLSDEVMHSDDQVTLKVLPADTVEQMWVKAAALVTGASARYHGTGPAR